MATLERGEDVEQLETEHVRKDGQRVAIELTVSPMRDSDGKVVSASVTGRDISRRKELEREVVDIASLEQRRIGQDLHDSVSQEMTALNLLVGDLTETLRSDPSNASQLVERLALGLQRSQQELRAVMRGLCPVSVDAEGLMAALSDLASHAQQEGKATCVFDCRKPVFVEDNGIATNLYLIAQEAVHNAVKHARCQKIRISMESNHLLVLRVQDDGSGIPDQPTEKHNGLGLRIMRNRAAIIGATLTIQPAEPTGTLVTCALARTNHETERSAMPEVVQWKWMPDARKNRLTGRKSRQETRRQALTLTVVAGGALAAGAALADEASKIVCHGPVNHRGRTSLE